MQDPSTSRGLTLPPSSALYKYNTTVDVSKGFPFSLYSYTPAKGLEGVTDLFKHPRLQLCPSEMAKRECQCYPQV